jgi:hypothetical protein
VVSSSERRWPSSPARLTLAKVRLFVEALRAG